jgi:DNA modification methylase
VDGRSAPVGDAGGVDSCLHLGRAEGPRAGRPDAYGEDVHFTDELVETFVAELSKPGDVVLDPFAGFGTTLAVAERFGRRAIGLEILPERVAHVRERCPGATVIEGDARRLSELIDTPVDLVVTSPPYMTAVRHPENPLNGYRTQDGDYDTYLGELREVFGQVAALLAPDGRVVVNVANIRFDDHVTWLAFDVARVLSEVLVLERDIVLCWPDPVPHFTNEYCLVFRAR